MLWKKAGGKNTRGKPLDPVFMAARSHSLVLAVVAHCFVLGAITVPMYVP